MEKVQFIQKLSFLNRLPLKVAICTQFHMNILFDKLHIIMSLKFKNRFIFVMGNCRIWTYIHTYLIFHNNKI